MDFAVKYELARFCGEFAHSTIVLNGFLLFERTDKERNTNKRIERDGNILRQNIKKIIQISQTMNEIQAEIS